MTDLRDDWTARKIVDTCIDLTEKVSPRRGAFRVSDARLRSIIAKGKDLGLVSRNAGVDRHD